MYTPILHTCKSFVLRTPKRIRQLVLLFAGLVLFALFFFLYTLFLNQPPQQFPVDTKIIIQEGTTVSEVPRILKKAGVVRSAFFTYVIFETTFEERPIQAGSYRFDEPLQAREIAQALVEGTHLAPVLTITLPEGFKANNIFDFLPRKYESVEGLDLKDYEGYLFPDTYFLGDEDTLLDIITLARNTFDKKIKPYSEAIERSSLTLDELVILASIIEREASDEESLRIVAGILLNRLEIDMPLQVDAVFAYTIGKGSSDLTLQDLKMDSPYNTYTNKGLPPTPISNPGLLAIDAVLNPIESEYFYFLTGNDGNFYYAETFEEHKDNRFRYLQ